MKCVLISAITLHSGASRRPGTRVRFLLGGRHGEFKFLPPSSYAPCYEALLPKEKMKVEPVKEYKRDAEGVRDLLGTAQFLSQASFIPTPVETSQVSPMGFYHREWDFKDGELEFKDGE